MKRLSLTAVLSLVISVGCRENSEPSPSAVPPVTPGVSATGSNTDSAPPAGDAETSTTAAASSSAPPAEPGSKTISLSEANTKIEFVGLHSGDKPDPRKGSFGKVTGSATVDSGTLKSIEVEIDTTSITTEIQKLTDHLKGPDFFDVNQHPTAKFVSTAVEPGEGGQVNVVGDLTLLGVTKSITIPSTISTEGGGLKMSSEFEIDRTEFGMTYGEGQVEKLVKMTVTIGA